MSNRIACQCCIPTKNYYVLKTWAGAVFVKEADFFKSQGGLKEDWGKNWKRIKATSIEDARRIAQETLVKSK